MTWSCLMCTFDNILDSATHCNICATRRPGNFTEAVKIQQSLSQRTLFGASAAAETVSKSSLIKKRSRPEVKQECPTIQITKAIASSTCSQDTFPVLWKRAQSNLQSIFQIPALRHLQPIAIQTALQRQSQIIIMATGGGKSLCYQLPATVFGGVTIVVSPLIALMQDQVQALLRKGISAAVVSSANGERKNAQILDRLLGRTTTTTTTTTNIKKNDINQPKSQPPPPITLLYGTPELLQTERFRTILTELYQTKRLAMIAIDEAHCLSTWGHDFRTAYRKLDWLRREFPNVPCIACTATATPKVIQDIRNVLLLQNAPCHMSSFNRVNISYQVRFKDSFDNMTDHGAVGDLLLFIQQQHKHHLTMSTPCSGIVYCHRRQDTESIAQQITKRTGIKAASYHAGLKDAERSQVQSDWTDGKIHIAVATVAFGMGVDLAHVRYVVHWSLPKTVEGFYQESGRSGRDLKPAVSVLYYSKDDASRFAYIIRTSATPKNKDSSERALEALELMVNYCVLPACRRQFLLQHFGEIIQPNKVCQKTCDYCQDPKKVARAIQASLVVKDVMRYKRGPIVKHKGPEWDGQWQRPHGDDDDHITTGEDIWADCDLGITRPPKEDEFRKPCATKRSLQSILNKYEAMECQENQKNGFVTFKDKVEEKSSTVLIPEHLRANAPDPFRHLEFAKPTQKSSVELGSERIRLEADLHKIKADQQAKLAALRMTSNRSAPPPPPPMLSFGSKKKR